MTVHLGSNTVETTSELEVISTDSGILIPRMTSTQRDAISSPAESLLVFNTTTNQYEWYDDDGSAWVAFSSSGASTNVTADQLVLNDGSELTIATAAITVTAARHTVDTESDAASDDLETISGTVAGETFILSANNTGRTVVLKNGTDNIICATAADITLDETYKAVLCVSDGTNVTAYPLFSSGGGSSPLTTKGDLYTYDSADARLAVGTNGQVLTADSAEATGIKWATSAAGVGDVSAMAYRSSTQSISNATWTTVLWNAEFYDTDTIHDTGSNTDRLTIPSGESGKWSGVVNITFAPNSTNQRLMRVLHYDSGSVSQDSLAVVTQQAVGSSIETMLNIAWDADLAATDYIIVQVYQNSGGSLNLSADNQAGVVTRASIKRIS